MQPDGADPVVNQHGGPTPAVGVVDAQRAELRVTGVERLLLLSNARADHCRGSIRRGACRPMTFEPDGNVAVFPPLITVTEPGPMARHSSFIHTAALRSSMPNSVRSGPASRADSTHRLPNVSK